MQKNLNLSIPKPCQEKWQNFSPTYNGGFCRSCSKVVVDFTKKGDDEIASFLKNKPAHACGRFRPDQLKVYLLASPLKIIPGFALLKAGVLSLLLLLISRPTSAQSSTEKSKTEINPQSDRNVIIQSTTNNEYKVKGVVTAAEDGSPLPAVNVIVKGTIIGTITDADGRFSFTNKLREGDVLVFSFIGVKTKEYIISKQESDTQDIQLNLEINLTLDYDFTEMMGELVVHEVYSPPSGLKRLWTKLKEKF